MAAKTHVDSSVGERRLRPIYEWLDNGNNKKALQEAEKVLKKQPNFLCAKVLKALALLRLGKEDECDQLLEAVRAEVPADDSTLQAMTICYREVHRPEKICSIYEAAVRKEPGSEELLTHLFMAYVRVADYKKQQQTALQLYRLKPKNPYYFWAVMSVVMQAHRAEAQLAQGVVLPLAERMVQKLVREERIEAEQEVQLYLMVLEMQSKFEEALRVVEGPLGEKLVSYVVVPVKRASLLVRLERWRDANVLYKQLLREDMDRWSYLTNYLTTCLKLFDSGQQNGNNNTLENCCPTAPNNINNNRHDSSLDVNIKTDQSANDSDSGNDALWQEADSTPAACCHFLEHLVAAAEKEERRLRGPYLAKLELFRLLTEQGIDAVPLLGKVADLLMHYVELFAEKPCCVSDLRRFLPLLPASDCPSFVQRVAIVTVRDPSGGVPALQRHICGLQLARMLGAHLDLTEAERQSLVADLLLFYKESSDLCTENLQTEFACNDAYVLLAAHVLADAWAATGQCAPLLHAAQLLEAALARAPANFRAKLLLLRVYWALGAGGAADAVYEALDVKHMQLDSLGFLHCAQLAAQGQLRAAAALYEATLKFFTANYKDGVDHLTYSYKFGSFLKIMEFVEFCDRLNNSLHYAATTVERMLLEVAECAGAAQARAALAAMEVQPWRDAVAWEQLQDNRDTALLAGWEPPCRQVTAEALRQGFADDVALLRVRSLTLRVLAAAAELPRADGAPDAPAALPNGGAAGEARRPPREQEEAAAALLARLAGELLRALAAAAERPRPAPAPFCAPPPSRLHALLAAGAVAPLAHLAAAVAQLAAAGAPGGGGGAAARAEAERSAAAAADAAATAAARAAGRARAQALAADGGAAGRREALAHAAAAAEAVALGALLVGAGRAALRPPAATSASAAPRRARRRRQQQQAPAAPPAAGAAGDEEAPAEGAWALECVCGLASALHAAAETLDAALGQWEAGGEARAQAELQALARAPAAGGPLAAPPPPPPPPHEEVLARLQALALADAPPPPSPPSPPPPAAAAAPAVLVRVRVADSQRAALRELRRLLRAKAQYLAALRLP